MALTKSLRHAFSRLQALFRILLLEFMFVRFSRQLQAQVLVTQNPKALSYISS